MQTCLHGNSIRELIDAEKSLSLRGMYYKGLHTVAGTKEKTFTDQRRDPTASLEDLEVSLASLREKHACLRREPPARWSGNITLVDRGDEIDCRRMGSGGMSDSQYHRARTLMHLQENRRRFRVACGKGHRLEPI